MARHQVHYMVGSVDDWYAYRAKTENATIRLLTNVYAVPLVVNPWDHVHFGSGFYGWKLAERNELVAAINHAKERGRHLPDCNMVTFHLDPERKCNCWQVSE